MKNINLQLKGLQKACLVFFSLVFVTACGSSGSNSPPPVVDGANSTAESNSADGVDSSAETSEADNSDGSSDVVGQSTTGEYDLSEYLFHRNVLTAGGEISFAEKSYNKSVDMVDGFIAGDGFFELQRAHVNNGRSIEEFAAGVLDKTFTITTTKIEEQFADDGDYRESQRFADVGDEYMNADSSVSVLGQQNATCTVLEHIDSLNLSSVTGDRTLATGVYEDVLKIECITGFIANGAVSPHTLLRSYHAKDIGVIFAEGTVFILGEVYIVEEY